MSPDPFGALGLPVRADLSDDDVRAAWRRIAAATHPDRADGGDPARFAAASAAYTDLRTRSGRGEAYTSLTERTGSRARSRASAQAPPAPHPRAAAQAPPAPHPGAAAQAPPAPHPGAPHPGPASRISQPRLTGRSGLASRVGRGRPALLAVRLAIAAAICAASFIVTGAQPAAFGLATGVVVWFLLTARRDLAP